MDTEAITVIVTVALAVFAIIWHQQRSTEKLRSEFTFKTDKLDERFFGALVNLRDDLTSANDKLRDEVVANGQRLARIEGYLRIGMLTDAVASEPSPAEPAATPPAAAPDPATKPATGA